MSSVFLGLLIRWKHVSDVSDICGLFVNIFQRLASSMLMPGKQRCKCAVQTLNGSLGKKHIIYQNNILSSLLNFDKKKVLWKVKKRYYGLGLIKASLDQLVVVFELC